MLAQPGCLRSRMTRSLGALSSLSGVPGRAGARPRLRGPPLRLVASAAAGHVHILGISGSLRKASTNTGLLRAAQQLLPPNTTLEIADIRDLPLFDSDLIVDGVSPAPVQRLRRQILAADACLFASPEYDFLVSPPLKNALDWCSLAPDNAWNDKPAAVTGAGGTYGTVLGAMSLRQAAVWLNLHFLNKPQLQIKRFEDPAMFDEAGDLQSEKVRERLRGLLEALVAWTHRLRQ